MYHSSSIEDFMWCHDPKATYTGVPRICSVETQFTVQLWQISDEFTDREIDTMHLVEKINENELE